MSSVATEEASLEVEEHSLGRRGGGSGRGHGAGFNSAVCFRCFGGGVEEGDSLVSCGRAGTVSVCCVDTGGEEGAASASCMSEGFDIASFRAIKADNLLMG